MILRKTMVACRKDSVAELIPVISAVLGIAALSQIIIPLYPVPFTGQTLGILLSAGILGRKKGMLAVLSYILLGTMGMPFFAGGNFGLARLAGPTGGYLTGFIAASFIVGYLSDKGYFKNFTMSVICMTAGNLVIYISGVIWLSEFIRTSDLLATGVYPFIPGDMIKIVIAASLVPAARKYLK
ncbi:MAG: biotin transporter BioY [Candidatus Delongbacteria bacterium]